MASDGKAHLILCTAHVCTVMPQSGRDTSRQDAIYLEDKLGGVREEEGHLCLILMLCTEEMDLQMDLE